MHLLCLTMSIYTLYVELARYVEFVSRAVERWLQNRLKLLRQLRLGPTDSWPELYLIGYDGWDTRYSLGRYAGAVKPALRQMILCHTITQGVSGHLEEAACF